MEISPEYDQQLKDLAERLVTPQRFGVVGTANSIQFIPVQEALPLGV